jgi:hypothetical protein
VSATATDVERDEQQCAECGHVRGDHLELDGGICVGEAGAVARSPDCPCKGFQEPKDAPTEPS